MKWLLVPVLYVAVLLGAYADVTIDRITLFNAQNPGVVWMTAPHTTEWILGVSDQPAGPLLNAPDSSVSGIPLGDYWLFADPADLGMFPVLSVHLSDGTLLAALFRVAGSNGTAQSWLRLAGSPRLSLGWAQGTVDLVGTTRGVHPDGINDFFMVASLGQQPGVTAAVPEPGAAALFIVGLGAIGLGAARRRRTS